MHISAKPVAQVPRSTPHSIIGKTEQDALSVSAWCAFNIRTQSQNLSFILLATVLKFPYTLPGGAPSIRLTTASLAILILLNPPKICIFESARTTLVRDVFSIANFVFPSLPAIRPIARPRCSPCRVLTSLISNLANCKV
jgi:hypothetical protein